MRMYIIIIHFIVKKITLLLFCSIAMLACKNPQKERLKELQDAANVWNIYNTSFAVVQTSMFLSSPEMQSELPGFCAYNISKMDSFMHFTFVNDTTARLAKLYVQSTKEFLERMKGASLTDEAAQAALKNSSERMDSLMRYASIRYALQRFTPLREASYYKAIAKKQYRTKENEQKMIALQEVADWRSAAKQAKAIAEDAKTPNERAVAWLDYADLWMDNNKEWSRGDDTIPTNVYRDLAFSNEFHLFKFEAWRKWRCLTQLYNYGARSSAFIPNKFYDSMRYVSVRAIANYLENQPMDSLGINEYFLLATHGPLLRYGTTDGGNQTVEELDELFDIAFTFEKKEDEETKATSKPVKKERRTKHAATKKHGRH